LTSTSIGASSVRAAVERRAVDVERHDLRAGTPHRASPIAHGRDDVVAALAKLSNELGAETARGAGDQIGGGHAHRLTTRRR
jgi:hypothetical protein